VTDRFLTQTWMVERRARQIADPIERLKYLRRQTHAPKARATMAGMQQFRFRLLRVTGVLVAAVMVAISGSWSPDAVGVRTREHKLLVPGLAAAMNLKSTSVISSVWQVEGTEMTEVYSNGLRVDLTFAVHNRPRANYPIYSLTGAVVPASYGKTPRGLLYHTTQSHLAPFEESSNRQLRQLGRNLLELLRRERSYHYVIDRFGRVYRVVEESDAANHSGNSIWGDADGIYVNLNDSFLGIAFEGQAEATEQVTQAQITAARLLTEMLRARYSIAVEDCVTHAQVSVNPLNMRIAAHWDWARGFPFAALGLTDNYALPPPSLYVFGFEYDSTLLKISDGGWKGLFAAQEQVARQADREGATRQRYRAMLQYRYKNITAALRQGAGGI
jgi:hypothetical protein